MALVKFTNENRERGLSPVFSNVFESLFNDSFLSDRMVSRVPAVNIAETDNEYQIELAAPGMKKDDFKINLDKNLLTISVEKKDEKTEEDKRYNKREYSYMSFVRTFTLPEFADQENIEAEYNDGILQLKIAKKEEAKMQAREISVK